MTEWFSLTYSCCGQNTMASLVCSVGWTRGKDVVIAELQLIKKLVWVVFYDNPVVEFMR